MIILVSLILLLIQDRIFLVGAILHFGRGGFKGQDKFVFVSIKNDAHSGKNANLSIDAQNATDNTPLSGVKIKQNEEKIGLYNLGYSPLNTIMIENCLEDYPDFKTKQELIEGLKFGFKLEYTGPRIPTSCSNSNSVLQNGKAVREKLSKEISLGRISGPFLSPPFPTFRSSPLALIPKSVPGEYRLILNLSYPPEKSVNDFIDKEHCTVRYSSIDDAVKMVQKLGKGALLAKADIKSAFRLLRIWPGDFDQLGFSFSGNFYFDKCLPMGAAVSCSLFEKFSSALHWYTEFCSQDKNIIHYLDDFLFGGEDNTTQCFDTLTTFQKVCK